MSLWVENHLSSIIYIIKLIIQCPNMFLFKFYHSSASFNPFYRSLSILLKIYWPKIRYCTSAGLPTWALGTLTLHLVNLCWMCRLWVTEWITTRWGIDSIIKTSKRWSARPRLLTSWCKLGPFKVHTFINFRFAILQSMIIWTLQLLLNPTQTYDLIK